MTKQEYFKLLDKYEAGLATQEEERLLHAYYNLFDLRKDGLQQLNEMQLTQLSSNIKENIDQKIMSEADQRRQIKLWPRIAVAAAAVAAITLGTWLYVNEIASSRKASRNDDLVANDIAPGKNTATLTLADGKVINLSDAKTGVIIEATSFKYSDGSSVLSSRGMAKDLGPTGPGTTNGRGPSKVGMTNGVGMTSVATPRGGTYQVTLPDGSRVWLNADSKIEFPSQFVGRARKIILSGEAYFEVSHNKLKPFVVQTDKQQVTVLGTHFNINSYADEGSTKTTLLEGSVSVSTQPALSSSSGGLTSSSLRGKRSDEAISKGAAVYLKPNQQSILSNNNRITVNTIDAEASIAWKNNKFVFDETDIRYIMRMIARWYNVEIVYTDAIPEEKFWGSVSRYENVSEVLKSLEQTGKIKFKIEGRKIIVTK